MIFKKKKINNYQKKKPNFSIICPIEISSRELVSKIFLLSKIINNKKGHIIIGSKENCNLILGKFDNQIYIDKGYHPSVSEKIYKKLKYKKSLIVSLDEENAVDYSDFSSLNTRFPEKVFHIFDLIFLWGNKIFNFLKKNRNLQGKNEKIFVSGHTKFELLKPSYNYLYKKKSIFLKKQYGEFILINTNFGLGNNIAGKDEVRKKYSSRISHLEGIMLYQDRQIELFLEMIGFLASKITKNIIIRPHPEESFKVYRHLEKEHRNIKVIYEGDVIPWLISCKNLIHHNCTTGIEYAMMGRVPISYTSYLNPIYVAQLPLDVSKKFDKKEEILKYITNTKHDTLDQSKINILNECLSYNKNSTKIISDQVNFAILKYFKNHNRVIEFFNLGIITIFLNFKNFIRFLLGIKKSNLSLNKLKGLNYQNIKETIKLINKFENSNLKAYGLGSQFYLIKNNKKIIK